jgi:hypothetical protein
MGGSSPYFPLAVGDVWVYNYYVDSEGVIIPGSKWTDVMVVTETEEVNGSIAYTVEDMSDNSVPRDPFIATASPLSMLSVDLQGNLLELADTMFGTQPAGIWNVLEKFSNRTEGVPVSYTRYIDHNSPPYSNVVDNYLGDSSVTVPAGTFDAIEYRDSSGILAVDSSTAISYTDVRQSFYSKGIGLVKFIDLSANSSVASGVSGGGRKIGVYAELVSYSVK